MKKFVAALIFLATCSQSAAGSVTWTAGVTLQYSYDDQSDQIVTTTTVIPGSTDRADRADLRDFTDGRYIGGYTDHALVDVQGPGSSLTVYVRNAFWNEPNGSPFGVPLFVYSYPSSALPPTQFDDSMSRLLAIFDIPVGTNTDVLTLNGVNTDGGVCFLLETMSSVVLGVPFLELGFDPPVVTASAVPEPSSFVLMSLAVIVVGVVRGVRK